MPLVEQTLLTLPEHLSSPSVRVTRSFVLCVCFVDRCLSFFFWALCCRLIFNLWILITSLWYLRLMDSDYLPLVSSNSSLVKYIASSQKKRYTASNSISKTCIQSMYLDCSKSQLKDKRRSIPSTVCKNQIEKLQNKPNYH